LAKAAEKRGVSVDQLTADLKATVTARIDAAEQAGKLTAEQAAAKRASVAEATGCKAVAKKARKARGKAKLASFQMLAAAAQYLDVPKAELWAKLKEGTTLAQLASGSGKSVSGLEDAMLAKAKERLAKAVSSGKLTDAQRDARVTRLEQLAERLVNTSFGAKAA
ncbi:MAG: hypothetical protein OEW65_06545, partial [Thermoleophilia bacterium]|nr:hypothetical protein [Thermoleophilia bacterium]